MKNYGQRYVSSIGFIVKETQLQRSMAGQAARQLMNPQLTGTALDQFNGERAKFIASLRATGIIPA